RRHTRCLSDWSSDVCSSDLLICLNRLRASPAQEMADSANNFLAALTSEQKAKATYEFKDDERFDWHFIPKPRKGLPFKEMTSPRSEERRVGKEWRSRRST